MVLVIACRIRPPVLYCLRVARLLLLLGERAFAGLAVAVAPTRTIREARRVGACRQDRGAASTPDLALRASVAFAIRGAEARLPRGVSADSPASRGRRAPRARFDPLAVRRRLGARAGGIEEPGAGTPDPRCAPA